MNDEYLDSVLLTISEMGGEAWKEQELLRKTSLSDTDDFDPAINFLVMQGYLISERVSYDYRLSLSIAGKRFIDTGGYTTQSARSNASIHANRIASSAKTIAILAITISAIVALAVAFMEIYLKK